MLGGSYYPAEFKNWPPLLYWFMGAVTAIMLFASMLLHELGHSVVAIRYRIPVRSITLFIFGGPPGGTLFMPRFLCQAIYEVSLGDLILEFIHFSRGGSRSKALIAWIQCIGGQ
jgi:Zn-dependent protease